MKKLNFIWLKNIFAETPWRGLTGLVARWRGKDGRQRALHTEAE